MSRILNKYIRNCFGPLENSLFVCISRYCYYCIYCFSIIWFFVILIESVVVVAAACTVYTVWDVAFKLPTLEEIRNFKIKEYSFRAYGLFINITPRKIYHQFEHVRVRLLITFYFVAFYSCTSKIRAVFVMMK